MKRINVYQFYQLANAVHPLTDLQPGKPLKEYMFPLVIGKIWLKSVLDGEIIPMAICNPVAMKVMAALEVLVPEKKEDFAKVNFEKEATASDLYYVIEGAKEFETVFSAELQNIATYFVSKKAIYDTNDLIARADELFTDNVRQYISDQAKHDIREAGKCLAFDLATAAGFHIARAVESTLVDYLKLLCPAIMAGLKESARNLGNYIKLARENDGDDKVCSSLDQFRDLHRNPLIHPESVLSIDEAITLLGIAQSSVVAIVLDTVKRKNQTLPLPVS